MKYTISGSSLYQRWELFKLDMETNIVWCLNIAVFLSNKVLEKTISSLSIYQATSTPMSNKSFASSLGK